MGIDLTLCPDQYGPSRWFLAYNRIRVERDYRILSQISGFGGKRRPIRAIPLPPTESFDWYGDEGIEQNQREDCYGDELSFAYAKDLAQVVLPDGVSDWNRAVFAFVCALHPDTRIVLWWH